MGALKMKETDLGVVVGAFRALYVNVYVISPWEITTVTNVCPSAACAGGIRKMQSPPKRTAGAVTRFIVFSLGVQRAQDTCLQAVAAVPQNTRNRNASADAPGATIVP